MSDELQFVADSRHARLELKLESANILIPPMPRWFRKTFLTNAIDKLKFVGPTPPAVLPFGLPVDYDVDSDRSIFPRVTHE